jgi:hypothetical protein
MTLGHGIDWAAYGTAVAVVGGWLPPVAALFSIVWFGLQIWIFLFVKKPWRQK